MALSEDHNIVQMVQPGSQPGVPLIYSTVVNVGDVQPASDTIFQQPLGAPVGGNPPGLEYLAQLNRVRICQVAHFDTAAILGWERNNEYRICNSQNLEFLRAKETTDACTRQMCGAIRPFTIDLVSGKDSPVMQLTRSLNCQWCCFPCCLQEMDIYYPVGNKLATIRQRWSLWTPQLEVYDVNDRLIYRIAGECCYIACFTDVSFKIYRSDGKEAGEITKHWAGCKEVFLGANDFSVTFAPGEHPLNKAILLGATFLVDFMCFEYK